MPCVPFCHHPFRLVGAIALMHDAHTKYKNAEYTNIRKRRNWWPLHLPSVPPFSVFMRLDDTASFASPPFSSVPLTACVCEGRMGSSDHCNTWSISGRIKWATRRDGRRWPLGVRWRVVSNAWRDVSDETRTVRGIVERETELHTGRPRRGRVQMHRQGMAQRAHARHWAQ